MAKITSIPKHLRLSSRQQSRELDEKTIKEFGIDGFTLMEIAGAQAAALVQQKTGNSKSGLFYCGTGNNAGDALVAARYLADRHNHRVAIFFVNGFDSLSPDAEKNLLLLQKMPGNHILITADSAQIKEMSFDYLVDGLLGTGLSREIESPYRDAVEEINQSGLPVFALDIPTGLDADSGKTHGTAVKTDYTITFGTNKTGLYLEKGPDLTGEVCFTELPFPSHLHKHEAVLVNEELQKHLEPVERVARHKYESGTVHLLAGSEGLTGAAIIAAKAAWKAGAGAVILYTPKKLLPVYEKTLPEIIKVPLGDESDSHYQPGHAETILKTIEKRAGVLAAGPGIGTLPETVELVENVLSGSTVPALLDADGLACWQNIKNIQKREILLTPHPGELSAYLNISAEADSDRIKKLKESVKNGKVSILSKGFPLVYINSSGELYITGYDTRIFARAGFGDVLAGTISAYWAVTGKQTDAVLYALINGYKTYKKLNSNHPFEPADLTI